MAGRFIFRFFPGSVFGWGEPIAEFHIKELISYSYDKRLFMFADRDYPYSLKLEIKNVQEKFVLVPVSNGGVSITSRTTLTSTITRRYKTVDDIIEEKSKLDNIKKIYQEFENFQHKEFEKYLSLIPDINKKIKIENKK